MSILKTRHLAFLGALSAFGAQAADYVPGELIVKFKNNSKSSLTTQSAKTFSSLGLTVDREINLSSGNLHVIKFDAAKDIFALQVQLMNMSDVEYAEPNFIYKIVEPVSELNVENFVNTHTPVTNFSAPNDTKFGTLWGLQNTGSNEPGSSTPGVVGADIDALKAWEVTTGSRAIRVAVIDTGIDYSHPDLANQMWVNEAEKNGEAGVDDDGNGYVDDVYGYDFANGDGDPKDGHSHGTHCAGTIGAETNNGIGIAGVMQEVELVAVKFLTDSGSGTTENAVKSIDYATKLNVDIMSNSWGGGGRSQALEDAIQRASDAGIIFTAAAGNSRSNNDTRPHYPSNYEVANVVSVAASTAQDDLASFSCYGKRTVHIAAPGHKIMSSVKNGGYKAYSGTSMATPHVSGALGLLLAHEGRMDHEVMKERLMKTSEPISAFRKNTIGGGRLNAYNLVTDTRPERHEPDPTKWQVVELDEVWESKHPYLPNTEEEREFKFEGAKFVRLKVKKLELENRYDYLQVSGKSRSVVEKISGASDDYVSDAVDGDTLIVKFKSDRSIVKWGFRIEAVEVQY